MEFDKTLYSDQFSIPWNILDKRARMIAAFAIYKTKLVQFRMKDRNQEIIVLECINYLFDELTTLQKSKIEEIKKDEKKGIISYDEAREIYDMHIKNRKPWDFNDMTELYVFVLEACKKSGIADPGYVSIDYTKTNALRGVPRG